MDEALLTATSLDEETARAEVYGLLAELYYAAPSAALHGKLSLAVTAAPTPGALLEASWSALVAAARKYSTAEIELQYNDLFGGVGKPEIYLFGSHYLSGFINEKPLAALRTDLAELGLARDEGVAHKLVVKLGQGLNRLGLIGLPPSRHLRHFQ